jgi:hypothetical protein
MYYTTVVDSYVDPASCIPFNGLSFQVVLTRNVKCRNVKCNIDHSDPDLYC